MFALAGRERSARSATAGEGELRPGHPKAVAPAHAIVTMQPFLSRYAEYYTQFPWLSIVQAELSGDTDAAWLCPLQAILGPRLMARTGKLVQAECYGIPLRQPPKRLLLTTNSHGSQYVGLQSPLGHRSLQPPQTEPLTGAYEPVRRRRSLWDRWLIKPILGTRTSHLGVGHWQPSCRTCPPA